MHSAEKKYIVLLDFKKIFSGVFVRGGRGRTFGEHPVAKAERRARRTISDIILRDSGDREEQGWYMQRTLKMKKTKQSCKNQFYFLFYQKYVYRRRPELGNESDCDWMFLKIS